jgi:hypothetical protein
MTHGTTHKKMHCFIGQRNEITATISRFQPPTIDIRRIKNDTRLGTRKLYTTTNQFVANSITFMPAKFTSCLRSKN